MKQTTIEDWRSPYFWGALGVSVAAICGSIDGINNYLYGIASNGMAAVGLLLAAALVVIIPGMAARNGWSLLKYSVLATALGLTLWAGYSNYEVTQRDLANKTGGSQAVYLRAAENYRIAKATFEASTEKGQVSQLDRLASQADARLADAATTWTKACKRSWTDACLTATADKKRAESDATAARLALSNAISRDKAEAGMKEAAAQMAAGPVTVREENPGVVYGLLALTQGGALLGGEGFALLMLGMRGRKEWLAKRRRQAPVPPSGGGEEADAGNVVNLDQVRASVKGWLERAAVSTPGGEMRGGEVWRLYSRSKGALDSATPADVRAALVSILGDYRVQARTSGYVVKGLELRGAQAPKLRAVR